MPKKKTLDEFIQEANIIHNNKYDYTKTNYINSKTKIIVICSTHGEFKICPSHQYNYHNILVFLYLIFYHLILEKFFPMN